MDFIYLASHSPRRSQLLEQLGIKHQLLLADEHEDAESLEVAMHHEAPRAYVQRVTHLKLDAALSRLERRGLPAAPVLSADTTVALGRIIFGKPADEADARRILTTLAGQTHRVVTAIAVAWGGRRVTRVSESRVRFAALSPLEISCYVARGESMGKAGAYAVQGAAAAFIAHLSGSYSGIMGLPLFETAQALHSLGVSTCNKTF
ncbi:MAG: Maf family nucleotide pyrophosphatase [Rhodoferax sp.]|nr:Maf family nucleotide pyrophosphatase [Rhodoferax sp.]MCF8211058.1 Maf family nucleotide pyrophosphatase [Rhodoferax sp.]